MTRVAAVVLAAGMASRYRALDPSLPTKLVASFGGVPLVRHVVDAALASRADPVVVVTGHAADHVRTALDGLAVEIAFNPDYTTGLASSLRKGLMVLPADVDGALVLLGDMPEVTARLIDCLIAAFAASTGMDAVVPVHGGRRGNPALLGRALFSPAATLVGDEGARRVLARARVLDMETDDGSVMVDVDDPMTLDRLRAG